MTAFEESMETQQDSRFTNPQPDEVDALLASELTNMSFEERGSIYEEIHGVDIEIVETPQLVAEALQLMETALQQQAPRLRELYNQARQINPEYVDSPSFWLQFLRAEYFVAPKAALRLCRFLAGKVEFFGPDSLARPITLDDFDPDDMLWLKTGIVQPLPSRDRSGRIVFGVFNMSPDYLQPVKIDSVFKTLVYLTCCIAEDEVNQKRGVVGLFYFNRNIPTAKRVLQRNAQLSAWLPLRFVAGHLCYDDARLRIFNAILMLAIGRERRVRLRMHEGSSTECQYKLMSFGVPIQSLPVTYDNELKTATHLQWLARRRIKETAVRMGEPFEGIDLPSPKDVLFGRGKTNQEHSGNILMRGLIAEYLPEYGSATRVGKGRIPLKVVLRIRKGGGRFLKRSINNGWWFQVSDDEAREKISMSLRSANCATSLRPDSAVQMSVGVHFEHHSKRVRTN